MDGVVRAVDGVTLRVQPGQTVGLVGESGCGKSVTAHSILRLLPKRTSQIAAGAINFQRTTGETVDMTTLAPDGDTIRAIRGNEISMIFQEPLTSLSPVHTVGFQIAEAVALHQGVSRAEARERTIHLLEQVGIAAAAQRFGEYPHQFSGGMRQRAMIAMALSCNPRLLIADEPTTALDVTIQAQILELIKELQNDMGMSVILITHDLGVIAETSASVVVMYAGKVAEKGTVYDIFDRPTHPYTRGLLESIPRLETEPKSKLTIIPGMVPGLLDMPKGCRFENRCQYRKDTCLLAPPATEIVEAQHEVACYEWRELKATMGSGGDSSNFKLSAVA